MDAQNFTLTAYVDAQHDVTLTFKWKSGLSGSALDDVEEAKKSENQGKGECTSPQRARVPLCSLA